MADPVAREDANAVAANNDDPGQIAILSAI